MYNFNIINVDTDSLTISKPDNSPFSVEEQQRLLKEINEILPEKIIMSHDGYFENVVVVAAKNYVLYDGKKLIKKGASLRDPKKCPALREFIDAVIDALLFDKQSTLPTIYNKYVKEIDNIQDIRRWCTRKTLSSTMQESDRTNETRVMDALEGSNYVEGDRFYTFFESPEKITLAENFSGVYYKDGLYRNLYNTAEIFESILPVKELFLNYSLKRNKATLEELLK